MTPTSPLPVDESSRRASIARKPAGALSPVHYLADIPDLAATKLAYWSRKVSVANLPHVDGVGLDVEKVSDLGGTNQMDRFGAQVALGGSLHSSRVRHARAAGSLYRRRRSLTLVPCH